MFYLQYWKLVTDVLLAVFSTAFRYIVSDVLLTVFSTTFSYVVTDGYFPAYLSRHQRGSVLLLGAFY